jgi:hypothetical protein
VGVCSCASAVESEWLESIPHVVQRDNGELYVTLNDGRKLSWKSDQVPFDSYEDEKGYIYRAYSFVDYFKSASFCLLEVCFHEGGTPILINLANGEQTNLEDIPRFNPNGSWFVVLDQDDYGAEIQTHGIEIWSLQKEKLKKEFEYKPERWPFVKVIWKSSQKVEFEVVEDFLFKPLGKNVGDIMGTLTFLGEKWVREE